MNFQQLRVVRETVRQNFNLTAVANALYASQSGVSKHIKDLEEELGVELFIRKGKRFLGLTEPGKELVEIVNRMLLDARNIKQLAEQFTQRNEGQLVIATTHTQARYALPQVVARFKAAFPKVHLVLLQGSPAEIVSLLLDGEADIGVATESLSDEPELACFPYYSWDHAVVVPRGHPLAEAPAQALKLADVAAYPVVTYHEGFTGRGRLDQSFSAAGVTPDIVMSALDSDVIKTYVRLGLGIGIVTSVAFESERDQDLVAISLTGLVPPSTTMIAIRRGQYLRGFAYRFLELCAPELDELRIRGIIQAAA